MAEHWKLVQMEDRALFLYNRLNEIRAKKHQLDNEIKEISHELINIRTQMDVLSDTLDNLEDVEKEN